jgi:hypothetical protein
VRLTSPWIEFVRRINSLSVANDQVNDKVGVATITHVDHPQTSVACSSEEPLVHQETDPSVQILEGCITFHVGSSCFGSCLAFLEVHHHKQHPTTPTEEIFKYQKNRIGGISTCGRAEDGNQPKCASTDKHTIATASFLPPIYILCRKNYVCVPRDLHNGNQN